MLLMRLLGLERHWTLTLQANPPPHQLAALPTLLGAMPLPKPASVLSAACCAACEHGTDNSLQPCSPALSSLAAFMT